MKLQVVAIFVLAISALALSSDPVDQLAKDATKTSNYLVRMREVFGRAGKGLQERLTTFGIKALEHVDGSLDKVDAEIVKNRQLVAVKGDILDFHVRQKTKWIRDTLDILEAKYWELRQVSKNVANVITEKTQLVLGHMKKTISKVRNQLEESKKRGKRQVIEAMQKAKQLYDLYQWSKKVDTEDGFKPFRDFLKKMGGKLTPQNQDGALPNGGRKSIGERLQGLRDLYSKFVKGNQVTDGQTTGQDKKTGNDAISHGRKIWEALKKGWNPKDSKQK
ncbi:hypothetical protein HDE_04521 [Halotydeus destructor]|nr:hypothetical protein HDE_04521 [Halotydeus destructor]